MARSERFARTVVAGGGMTRMKSGAIADRFTIRAYAHLRPDLFASTDLATLKVSMRATAASIEGSFRRASVIKAARKQSLTRCYKNRGRKTGVAL